MSNLNVQADYTIQCKVYNNTPVRYIPELEYWCVTDVANATGKRVNDYYRLAATKDFLTAYSELAGIPVGCKDKGFEALFCSFNDHSDLHGTWVTNEVFTDFAQWVSMEFRLLANKWVTEILSGKTVSLNQQSQVAIQSEQAVRFSIAERIADRVKSKLPKNVADQYEVRILAQAAPEYAGILEEIKTDIADSNAIPTRKLLTPSQIAELLVSKGYSAYNTARKVNTLLEKLGLQTKPKKNWKATVLASENDLVSEVEITAPVQGQLKYVGRQLKWQIAVVDYIIEQLQESTKPSTTKSKVKGKRSEMPAVGDHSFGSGDPIWDKIDY